MGHDLDHYRHIPLTAMPYGQAMAMLCLVEALQQFTLW
jgi:unsaturated rhamnogalacturonyl hydrolase